ncbi:MAG: peptidase M23, partial [Flavobacteriaceae bacterium]|nr:peptidase M23 [Flavobacteriaceae bacterium]
MSNVIFQQFLSEISKQPIYVVETNTSYANYLPIDISSSNQELNAFDINNPELFWDYIKEKLDKFGSEVAYGGYLEVRDIYKRSGHFFESDPKKERNIHLGVDFWCKEQTPVS